MGRTVLAIATQRATRHFPPGNRLDPEFTCMKYSYLIFDFDGTLVESAIGMTACMNQLMDELGRPHLSVEQVGLMVGQGIQVTVTRAMDATGDVPADVTPHVDRFKALYYQQPVSETPLYPGVVETLERLAADGHVMGVCTNKVYDATMRLLEGLDIARFFKAVAGGDSYPVRKPNPGHLEGVMDAIGASKAESVMIGDSINDIGCANAAGVRSVAVSYGYTKTPPHELGANKVIDSMSELPGVLAALD